jgi:hypothetical protein
MGDENGPPQLTEEDKQQIRNEMKAAVISAAQASPAGKVPAGVRRMIDEFTSPVMDWRALLEAHIQSSIKDDFTFNRPSRRSWSTEGEMLASVIMPGQSFKDTVSVAIAIDTSGSMTDEMLRDFLSEVKGIMETFDEFELWLWTFDTRVYNPKKFTPMNLDEIYSYVPQGGGGTLFESCWDFMREPMSVDPEIEIDFLDSAELPNSINIERLHEAKSKVTRTILLNSMSAANLVVDLGVIVDADGIASEDAESVAKTLCMFLFATAVLLDVDLGQAYDVNIAKLAKRYGDKYSDYAAVNRDIDAERAVLEAGAKV